MTVVTGVRRPTVLVADDSPQNIELLSRVLGQEYRIKVATSGDGMWRIMLAVSYTHLTLPTILLV